MTAMEISEIKELRSEVHSYHEEVVAGFARCESCRADTAKMSADMYGLPGNKDASPGLMGEVAELRGSRRRLLLAMQCAWALLVAVAGTIVAAFFGRGE